MKQAERKELILSTFRQYYLGYLRTSFSDWAELLGFMQRYDEVAEDGHNSLSHLVEELIQSMNNVKYPMSEAYRYSVLKWIQQAHIDNSWPLPDTLITALSAQPEHVQDTTYIFKHYTDADITLLEENKDPISQGTTGLISWQGAVLLSHWAENMPSLMQGKTVLELGSGLGLFGLTMAKKGILKEVIMTDCHPKVLNSLHLNTNLNAKELPSINVLQDWLHSPPNKVTEDNVRGYKEHFPVNNALKSAIGIRHLDWTAYEMSDLPHDSVDLVLGSDLVYAECLLPHLIALLRDLLQRNLSRSCEAYIACTRRNGNALNKFLELLSSPESGLRCETCLKRIFSPADCIMVNHEGLKPVFLYHITLAK